MTVRELIDQLQEFPVDRPVALSLEDSTEPGLYEIAVADVETLWADLGGHRIEEPIVGICPADDETTAQ